MDFHKYSFYKLAFMLNVTGKSENETFFLITQICEFTETWVVTQVISNRSEARNSKSKEQYDYKLFFRLDGTPVVELSNSTGWDFESTIKFNASTSEEYYESFVCGSVVPKSLLT